MLAYFCQERKAGCIASTCIWRSFLQVQWLFVHSEPCSWNERGGGEGKEEKTTKKAPCVVSFTTHSKTFKSAPARRGNPIRIMLSLSIPARTLLCRAAQPRDGLFMSLEQHHEARPPLRPTGTCSVAGTPTAPTPNQTKAAQQSFRKNIFSKLCTCTKAY